MAGRGRYTHTAAEAANITLGQQGSILVAGTSKVTAANGVFCVITFLEDTVFDSGSDGLVAESTQLWPDSTGVSSDISANGAAVDSETFPAGVSIYGRWTDFTLASGKVVAYVG